MATSEELRDPPIPPGEIVALQVGAIARLTPVMMAANLVNMGATLAALRLTWEVTPATLIWAATIASYSAFMLWRWLRRRDRPFPATLGPRTRRRAIGFAALLGLLWGYPGLALLPHAPPLAQAYLIALCAGMVSGGAITLYPLPLAALSYAGVLAGAHLAGFALSGEPIFYAFVAVTVMFLVVIAWGVRRHEQIFVGEFVARRLLAARTATVEQLLAETRSEAVRDRREAEARLAQVQHLDALGRLTAGVAHDFNNLLAAVLGNLELARTRAADPETTELLDAAADATRRGAALTRQLLAFGRKAPLNPVPVDPERAVAELRAMLTRTLPADVSLRTRVAGGPHTILADEAQFGTALLNLVLNACDAMPAGGTVEVALDHVAVAADHPLTRGADAIAPGDYVAVAVTDDGTGVAPDVLARVFEPFFTTKGVGAGSGLGLAMVYGFARQSGGHCTIRSRPGDGTTVRMLLPVAEGPAARPAAEAAPVANPHGDGARILVVEDTADVRDVIARQLRALGFDAVIAPDGATALAMLRGGVAAELLLTDLVMPGGLQGPALARRARAEGLVERVLFMSAYPDGTRGDGPSEPLDAPFLQKPVGMAALGRAVRAALAGRAAAPEGDRLS